jgi:hypothetical protein
MRRTKLLMCLTLLFFSIPLLTQGRAESEIGEKQAVNFPDVPRISAYEAYVKYKAGKAIIVQAAGEAFERRHILGAFGNKNVSSELIRKGELELPHFPYHGIEIFTYCY